MSRIDDRKRGFTIIELMITIAVAAFALLVYIGANLAIDKSSEAAHQRTVAMQDAQQIIELIRETSQSGSFPDNVVETYPDATAVSGYSNLPNENVVVTYQDPDANPLDVTVSISWTSWDQRTVSTALRTLVTQRL